MGENERPESTQDMGAASLTLRCADVFFCKRGALEKWVNLGVNQHKQPENETTAHLTVGDEDTCCYGCRIAPSNQPTIT